jgi:uncharacterized protein YegP (UPF0339 family)
VLPELAVRYWRRPTGWIRRNSGEPDPGRAHGGRVRAQKGSTDKLRFNLVPTNGQVIATSEACESKASTTKGIESVNRSAPTAEIDAQRAEAITNVHRNRRSLAHTS